MKIIFLDIDGVLNSQLFYTEKRQVDRHKEKEFGSDIDERCVDYLNVLIKNTRAKVVISSTWRASGLEYCKQHLEASGFKGEIVGLTPHLRHEGCVRGNEIYHWINENSDMLYGKPYGSDFKDYVIFDDDSDMLLWQQHNYIHVDGYCGLTPNNAYKAERILNSHIY